MAGLPASVPKKRKAIALGLGPVLLLLLGAALSFVYMTAPLEPAFDVGKCVAGSWSEEDGGELTGVGSCAEPHDFEVIALSEEWSGCPSGTHARVPYMARRSDGSAHYMCLAATP